MVEMTLLRLVACEGFIMFFFLLLYLMFSAVKHIDEREVAGLIDYRGNLSLWWAGNKSNFFLCHLGVNFFSAPVFSSGKHG